MKKWIYSILLLYIGAMIFLADPAVTGTIVRGDKASGGTAFVSGYAADPGEVNTDFDTIYNEFNGSIDADNIAAGGVATSEILDGTILNVDVNASAGIVSSKLAQGTAGFDALAVDDFSGNTTEIFTTLTSGTPDSPSAATNLQEELSQLRLKVKQLTVGNTTVTYASSAGTATDAGWLTSPARGRNLIYNGGFDVLQTLAAGTDGDGWTNTVSNPDTLQAIALTEAQGHGDGNAIQIVAGAGDTNEGITQTLDGLKADTIYLAQVWVKDTTNTCNLSTTGADTNQCSDTSDDSANWQLLKCTFETDSTPTNVVYQLLAVDNSSDCIFEDASVYELSTDHVAHDGHVVAYDSSTTGTNCAGGPNTIGNLSVTVVVPGPGYMIDVHANITINVLTSASNLMTSAVDIQQKKDAGGAADVGVDGFILAHSTNDAGTVHLSYMNTSPTPGSTYVYTVTCDDTGIGTGDNQDSDIYAMLIPPGG